MRISEERPDRLVLTQSPVGGALFMLVFLVVGLWSFLFWQPEDLMPGPWSLPRLLGAIFVSTSAFMLLVCTGRTTLVMDRRADRATVRFDSLVAPQRTSVALSDIVELQAKGGDSERLELALRDGTSVPLTKLYYTGGDHPKVRAAVNAWLAERPAAL